MKDRKIPEAKATTRAAQMLAEMLAFVRHPEYYQQGEQTVILQKVCISYSRLLSSTLLASKLRFTAGAPPLPLSSAKFIPKGSRSPRTARNQTHSTLQSPRSRFSYCVYPRFYRTRPICSRRTRQCRSATQAWDRH